MIYSIRAVLPNRVDSITGEPTSIDLSMFNPYKNGFAITKVTGIGPIKSNITMDDWATVPGANKNTMHRSFRTIGIKLRYIGQTSIEDLRHMSYKYFPVEEDITLQFTTDSGTYCIDGIVEDNGVDMWTKAEESNLSIVCGDPFFYAITEDTHSFVKRMPQFHFFDPNPETKVYDPFMPSDRFWSIIPEGQTYPIQKQPFHISRKIRLTKMTINNPSSLPVGLKIQMNTTGTVKDPMFVNMTTNEGFYLSGTIEADRTIIINTRSGHKSVIYGDGSNAINRMDINSKWIQLIPGENTLKFSATDGTASMDVSLSVRPIYEGI